MTARDLWSWEEYPRFEQRDRSGIRQQSATRAAQNPAAFAEIGIEGINSRSDRAFPQLAAERFLGGRGTENMPFSRGECTDTGSTREDFTPPMAVQNVPVRFSTTEPLTPAEVTDRGLVVKEDYKPIHNHGILAGWDDLDEPEDWEIPDSGEPWTRGENGKGLIGADGQLLTWRTNEYGEPHHDDIATKKGFPYVAKMMIRPNGSASIPSPDELSLFGIERDNAEAILAEAAPANGLKFTPQYTAKVADRVIPHENAKVLCPTCGDLMEKGICNRCQWSPVDVNIDSDPLSNPPDPTVDLHRGIQAAKIIQSHRWQRWFDAVEDF